MNRSEAGKLGYLKTQIIFKQNYKNRLQKYLNHPTRCKFCNTPLPYKRRKNKFCNHSCAASLTNLGNRKHGNPKEPANCLNCGKKLNDWRKKYCNGKCQGSYRRKQILEKWITGDLVGFVGKTIAIRSVIRKYLIQKVENKCSKCGWNEINPITQKVPLEINHIDGNAKNCVITNLEVLCPNCHALTPNFRNLNRISARNRMPK